MQRQNRYPQHLIPDPFVYRKVLHRSRSNQLVRPGITNLKNDSSFERKATVQNPAPVPPK